MRSLLSTRLAWGWVLALAPTGAVVPSRPRVFRPVLGAMVAMKVMKAAMKVSASSTKAAMKVSASPKRKASSAAIVIDSSPVQTPKGKGRGVPKPKAKAAGTGRQAQLLKTAQRLQSFRADADSEEDDEPAPVLKKPAGAENHALVDESTTTDRLKKSQWNKAVREGKIDKASQEAHAKASQQEARNIINQSVIRHKDGTYTLALNNAALKEVHSS